MQSLTQNLQSKVDNLSNNSGKIEAYSEIIHYIVTLSDRYEREIVKLEGEMDRLDGLICTKDEDINRRIHSRYLFGKLYMLDQIIQDLTGED